ncbi:hypothetical protein L6R29_10520 [Myxococcota bacterium]|nr:hypothetical protein [Myxococcota bacterium]
MRNHHAPPLHVILISLLFAFSIFGYLEACGPQATSCKADSDCSAQEYCAPTSGQSICTKRSESIQDGSPDADPQPDTPTQTGCDIPAYDPTKDPGNGGTTLQLDQIDQFFFRKLREIFYLSQQCSEKIWGGSYQLHKVPTYIANIGSNEPGSGKGVRGFLINHPNPPQGSTLIDTKSVFGIPNVYAYDGAIKDITPPGFMFDLPINNTPVYAFSYGTSHATINPTTGNQAFALYVHEGFHRIQDFEEAWKYPQGIQDPTGYPYDTEQLTLALLEDAILTDGHNEKITAEQALQWFYAARKERIKLDNSPNKLIQSLENFQEWLEGTAMYSEILYLNLLKIPYPLSDPNSIPGRLTLLRLMQSDSNASKKDVIETLRGRYYASGAAQGVLLERLGNKTWKDQIRKSQTFYDILNELYSGLQTESILHQTKTKYDYDALKKIGQNLADRR